MKPLKLLIHKLKGVDWIEYYTLLVLTVFIPVCVGLLTSLVWGAFLSFVIQAIIGVLALRGKE